MTCLSKLVIVVSLVFLDSLKYTPTNGEHRLTTRPLLQLIVISVEVSELKSAKVLKNVLFLCILMNFWWGAINQLPNPSQRHTNVLIMTFSTCFTMHFAQQNHLVGPDPTEPWYRDATSVTSSATYCYCSVYLWLLLTLKEKLSFHQNDR